MNIITLDFETFFSDEYTLKKMTTEAYVRDPRFETHGAAIKFDATTPTTWWPDAFQDDGSELGRRLAAVDWSQTVLLCHHAHFDGLILSHHYGIKPALWLDTLSMARLMLGNHVRVGLESLASHYGLEAKTVPYNEFRGKRWSELDGPTRQRVAEGARHDVELTWSIFCELSKGFPAEEYGIIDATIRMFTEPKIVGDTALLAKVWQDEEQQRRDLLTKLLPGYTFEAAEAQLASNECFAGLLRQIDVEPEWKAGKNGPIYAFAKSDDFMQELLEADDDTVRLLAEARVNVKSTLPQTRAGRLGWMSTRGAMCVYISYCAAHTTRDGGGDKTNFQNLQRARADDPKRGRIRRSMQAPSGYLVGVVDASQIECRMLNEFAGQDDIVQKFREKRDLYSELASQFYGWEVTKANAEERGVGKQLELSCGYGAGDDTIVKTAAKGTYGPPVYLTLDQGRAAKNLYRRTHQHVERLWAEGGEWLKWMGNGWLGGEWGCLRVECSAEASTRRIVLPNGAPLIYDTLEWFVPTTDDELSKCKPFEYQGYWRIKTRKGWVKMYGAKLVENIIQALARVHVFQVMLRIRAAGVWVWGRNHDELALLIKKDQYAEQTLEWCRQQMGIAPAWMPNVPLDAEALLGERYEK